MGKAWFVSKRLAPWTLTAGFLYPQLVVATTVLAWASVAEALESVGGTPKLTSQGPPELPPDAPDPIRTPFKSVWVPTEYVANILRPFSKFEDTPICVS